MSTEIPNYRSTETQQNLTSAETHSLVDPDRKIRFSEKYLDSRGKKFGALFAIGAATAGLVFGSVKTTEAISNNNENNADNNPNVVAPLIPGGEGSAEPTVEPSIEPSIEPTPENNEVIEGQTLAPEVIQQYPELQERYDTITESLRMPVSEYPTATDAYEKVLGDIQNWINLYPNIQEITQYADYQYTEATSDRETSSRFGGAGGVMQNIDQKAYAEVLFNGSQPDEFIHEMNVLNLDSTINNAELLLEEETAANPSHPEELPFAYRYEPIEEPRITVPASDNNLTSINISIELSDNAMESDVAQLRIDKGQEPSRAEIHNVLFQLETVGEGDEAEWKISHAEIYSKE